MSEIMEQAKQYGRNTEISFDRVSAYNNSQGTLTGFDCSICRNKGNIMYISDEGEERLKQCECIGKRQMLKTIHESGLEETLSRCTFENFQAVEEWQQSLKSKALSFIENNEGKWFYVGGQVGSGKTHICTAIVGKLIEAGNNSKYMSWRDEIITLKTLRNTDDFQRVISEYKKAKVLYIDDLFKTMQGKQPTQSDIDIAFEIINYRYMHKDLITIFSCEKYTGELMSIDEAVGSRIIQRSRGYNLAIAQDDTRNYRVKT